MKQASKIFQYGVNPELDTHVHEGVLLQALNTLFDVPTLSNVKKKTALKYQHGTLMEVDAFVPKYNLGFEFQDSYHYVTTWYHHQPRHTIATRDKEKVTTAHQTGLDLIAVPCWWDGKIQSLKATIEFYRPDVLLNIQNGNEENGNEENEDENKNENYFPISLNPPDGYFSGEHLPVVGEMMLASFPVMNSTNTSIYNNIWWIGEKYDGVRFCWNPHLSNIYTRTGRSLSGVLSHFHSHLPSSIFIDGELWFGRGNYIYAFMLVKSVTNNILWNLFRMVSFDDPVDRGPIEHRFANILSNIIKNHPFMIVPTRLKFQKRGRKEMTQIVKGIIDEGGEGAILHKLSSTYQNGRTPSLIKLKIVQSDKEAIVIQKSHQDITLKTPNGTVFKVPNYNIHVTGVTVGAVVTYASSANYKADTPVGPVILRVRTDLSWSDVLATHNRDKRTLNDHSSVGRRGVWGARAMRRVMTTFAGERGLDPLLLHSWLSIPRHDLLLHPGMNTVLKKFQGRITNALRHLFPELNLYKDTKAVVAHRRKIFENYAKDNLFDPLVPDNWYAQSRKKILKYPGVFRAIFYHNQIVSKTIMDLFPNIGLEKSKFTWDSKWGDVQKRRQFFESYAQDKNFDPLVAANWYLQPRDNIINHQGGQGVLYHYNGNLFQALVDCFPDIGLDISKFTTTLFWKNPKNRRKFLEDYAAMNGFDPLVPDNWYSHSYLNIANMKDAKRVLIYHGFNIRRALLELFPEINLQISKLKDPGAEFWESVVNRRAVFESFAQENGFDPLCYKNWYNQSSDKILAIKGINGVLPHHEKRISKALFDLFPDIGFPSSLFRFRKKKNCMILKSI